MSERLRTTPENNVEFTTGEREKLRERLSDDLERRAEQSHEHSRSEQLEVAHHELNKVVETKPEHQPSEMTQSERSPSPRDHIASHDKDLAFRATMTQARTHMNPAARTFSKFIHLKAVERTSDAIGGTLARPNTILYGAMAALIIGGTIYGIAKYYGYALSGSESLAAFAAGWLIGLTVDYTQVLLHGGRNKH